MAFETLKAQIALILEEMSQRPEDAHVLQERVRETLAEMRGLGLPLPQDLVELEASLEADFEATANPRRRSHEGPPIDD